MLKSDQRKLQETLIHQVTHRSAWQTPSRKYFGFICPQCRAERRVPLKPSPVSLINLFRVFLCALLFTIVFFGLFGFKGMFVFFPMWVAFEILYRVRVRGTLACPSCGFDAYLYAQDPHMARKEIEHFWRDKFAASGIPFPGEESVPSEPGEMESEVMDNPGDQVQTKSNTADRQQRVL